MSTYAKKTTKNSDTSYAGKETRWMLGRVLSHYLFSYMYLKILKVCTWDLSCELNSSAIFLILLIFSFVQYMWIVDLTHTHTHIKGKLLILLRQYQWNNPCITMVLLGLMQKGKRIHIHSCGCKLTCSLLFTCILYTCTIHHTQYTSYTL